MFVSEKKTRISTFSTKTDLLESVFGVYIDSVTLFIAAFDSEPVTAYTAKRVSSQGFERVLLSNATAVIAVNSAPFAFAASTAAIIPNTFFFLFFFKVFGWSVKFECEEKSLS